MRCPVANFYRIDRHTGQISSARAIAEDQETSSDVRKRRV